MADGAGGLCGPGEGGVSRVPSTAGSLLGIVVVAGFGVFWTIAAASMGAPSFFPIFGVFFVILAVVGGISGMSKASGYEAAKAEYEAMRKRLYDRMRGSDER